MPPPLSKMSHRARLRYIAQLQAERGGAAKRGKRHAPVPMPDLSCGTSDGRLPAPLTNAMGARFSSQRTSSAHHPDAKQFPSSTLFKQGPQLITPGDIESGRVHDYGGHKPNKGSF